MRVLDWTRERAFAVRIIAACAVALMLAGCATKSPAATEQERIDAMAALDSCLHAAARKLDDGRSEASTIALVYGDQLSPLGSQIYHVRRCAIGA